MEYLTVEEVAAILRINKYTLYKWSETGKIPCRRFGGKCLRFVPAEIEEFCSNSKYPVKKTIEGATK